MLVCYEALIWGRHSTTAKFTTHVDVVHSIVQSDEFRSMNVSIIHVEVGDTCTIPRILCCLHHVFETVTAVDALQLVTGLWMTDWFDVS